MLTLLLIFAAAITFTAILIFSITLALKSSMAYRRAVKVAMQSAAVIEIVGEPIKEGLFVRGGLRGGLASLHVRLYGPKGLGKLKIRASQSDEELQFEVLKFYSGVKVVDLLSKSDKHPFLRHFVISAKK